MKRGWQWPPMGHHVISIDALPVTIREHYLTMTQWSSSLRVHWTVLKIPVVILLIEPWTWGGDKRDYSSSEKRVLWHYKRWMGRGIEWYIKVRSGDHPPSPFSTMVKVENERKKTERFSIFQFPLFWLWFAEKHTKRQATQHGCLPSLLGDGDKKFK